MALNIKNKQVESLVEEVTAITGENKTEAVLNALLERKQKLALYIQPKSKSRRKLDFLKREIWSVIPKDQLGKALTKKAEENILGLGENGV